MGAGPEGKRVYRKKQQTKKIGKMIEYDLSDPIYI
jgi:hypothetical protein